jgi:hypothetical protein
MTNGNDWFPRNAVHACGTTKEVPVRDENNLQMACTADPIDHSPLSTGF